MARGEKKDYRQLVPVSSNETGYGWFCWQLSLSVSGRGDGGRNDGFRRYTYQPG